MKAKQNISKKRNPFNCIVIILTTLYIISITSISLQAQQPISNDFSRTGECLSYTIYYKWGALMPRAGDASLSFEKQDRGFRSRLLFRTAPFFDAIFSMRDTLDCNLDHKMRIVDGQKHVMEGGDYTMDLIHFSRQDDRNRIHTKRFRNGESRIDTVEITNQISLDMIGAILYLRSTDWSKSTKERISVRIFAGKKGIDCFFQYEGSEVQKTKKGINYHTHRVSMLINESETFKNPKKAITIWLTNDANRIPVRIRMELRIGAAEVYLKSAEGLRHPLSSRIR